MMAGCLTKEGEGAKKLRAAASSRLHILQLDVTSADDVLRAVQEVEALLPEGGECDGASAAFVPFICTFGTAAFVCVRVDVINKAEVICLSECFIVFFSLSPVALL